MAAFSRNTLSRYTTGIPSPPSLPDHYTLPPAERPSQKGDGQNKSRPAAAGRLGGDIPFGGTAQLGYCQPRPLSSLRLRFMSSPTTSLAGFPW